MPVLLAVSVGLLDNWKDYVEGPKYGNATKPETRRAKEEQWELTAATRALDNPFATVVTSALAVDSRSVRATVTLAGHAAYCNYVAARAGEDSDCTFIGFNIYRNIKLAAVGRLRETQVFPHEHLDMSHAHHNPRLIDPLRLVMSGFSSVTDQQLVCRRLGISIPASSLHGEMEELVRLSTQLGLIRG